MRLLLLFAALLYSAWYASAAIGAEINLRPGGYGVSISGPIERGDYQRLTRFILGSAHRNAFLSSIYLNSPGGDVQEAMKIANLLDKSFAMTFVDENSVCASACVLIWAGGATRSLQGKLGVHRISLSSASVDVDRQDRVVHPASLSVESFLRRAGIPRRIIDKMNETSSSDVFMIDTRWLIEEDLIDAVSYRPAFIDIAARQCGPDPFAAAGRSGIRISREQGMKWGTCVDDIRSANQTLHLKEIVQAIIDGSGYGRLDKRQR
jgi:hypothetical protein